MKRDTKKTSQILRVCMMVFTIVLIVLFFLIMSMVGKIQGTARVVNYAGLVRGKTQRMVKLENSGSPQDAMIASIESYIDGLENGSGELNLVRLEDEDFQNKMKELDAYFDILKSEVLLVREKGYENTDIIAISEEFFEICDEATGLAETYSQRLATSLNHLEQVVFVDIAGLMIVIGVELVKALRYASLNRILQSKIYLDEATGLPNKNKCEELLASEEPVEKSVAVCMFDMNNLRNINNNFGHEKGDEYIRSFGLQLKAAVPEGQFAGRNGGDEFIAIFHGVDHEKTREYLQNIRRKCDEYSKAHPDMPISYAAGYALSDDFENSTMRDLFRLADKNMYIDKNRAKMEEAAEEKKLNYRLLDSIRAQGFHFSDCLYCDAQLDQYRILRAGDAFFLADSGSYSGAIEQIVQEFSAAETRRELWRELQLPELAKKLSEDQPKTEIICRYPEDGKMRRGRLTILFVDRNARGELHHFILGFETFRENSGAVSDDKAQLTQYYEQLKQSILENGNYVDALIETAGAVYSVDLTDDRLESVFIRDDRKLMNIDVTLPCSYDEYCRTRSRYITEDTLENYRIVDSSEKLRERFHTGSRQVTVEYLEQNGSGGEVWLQKTVLMSRELRYNSTTGKESMAVRGIILFKNTSAFHEKEQEEKKRLQMAYEEADSASRAKTAFLNRMGHDIRTPLNGILGMLGIIRKNQNDRARVNECLDKMQISANHLLALVNDVLEMSRLQSGHTEPEQIPFDLEELMHEVSSLVQAQMSESGIRHRRHRKNLRHTSLIGSPLHLRQIMLNLFSNAIKYNRPGGTVDTWAEELSSANGIAQYEFRIVDTGIGMSEEFVRDSLFEPFTQEKNDARTQYQGTGLGMSIVKELLDKMNGTLEVKSKPGVGTEFRFRLSFALNPDAEDETAVPETLLSEEDEIRKEIPVTDEKPLFGKKILLVEDNEINMEIAEFYLKENGADVVEAWNGQEALDLFQASGLWEFDFIFMDVMMPVMDGQEAARRIRALPRADAKVPIVAMTAQASSESARECEKAGMNSHMPKPIDPETMIRMVLRFSRSGH